MLKVTTRYLASHFIPPFVMGFVFFLSFLITFYMFRVISLIVSKGVDLWTITSMILNLSISFIPLAAPLSAFFATVYTLNKLSEDSEIIALRSFGYTKQKIFMPFLAVSLMTAVMVNSLYSDFIPKANAAFKNTIVMLTSSGMLTSIKSGQFFTEIPHTTIFAESVSEDGSNFKDIFLHLKDKGKDEKRVIFAHSGSLIKIYADQWHAPSLRLHLTDGNIVKMNSRGDKIEKVIFNEYDFPIFNADMAVSLLDKDSMKTNDELVKIINTKIEKLKSAEILKNNDEIQNAKISMNKTKIELYSRYVTFTQILLFVFVGFSLGVKRGRGARGNNMSFAMIILVSYFIFYFFLISLSQKGKLDPLLATFGPSLILLFAGTYFFKKLDWAS